MRRSLPSSALAAAVVVLGAAPADADPGDGGGWVPVPAEYWAPLDFPACGDTIRIEGGDVREAEQRVTEHPDGTVVTELRGAATVDLTRLSDGAVIDELDIGGRARTVITTADDTTTIVNTLNGSTVLFPFGAPIEVAAFEEAGLPDLGYYADKDDVVTVEVTIDAAEGTLLAVEFVDIDADIVDLCPWFDHGGQPPGGADDDGDDDDDDEDDARH